MWLRGRREAHTPPPSRVLSPVSPGPGTEREIADIAVGDVTQQRDLEL